MKTLWVVNKYTGALHEKVFNIKSVGGLWLDAMLDTVKQTKDEIVVVNVAQKPKIKYFNDGNISYYTVDGKSNENYNYYGKYELEQWKEIIEKEKPQIIMLWGTEFPFGLSTLKVAPNIPHIVFVQGVLGAIGKYYTAGITQKELKKATTLRDILTHNTIKNIADKFSARAKYEEKIIALSNNVIISNKWALTYYKSVFPNANFYKLPLNICDDFGKYNWTEENMQCHTVMCPAADYPIKGLHMLLKALKIVKQRYADVKLYVPGTPFKKPNSFFDYIKLSGYSKLILYLTKEYGLENTVIYTGRLTAEQMAEKMSVTNCFVMCSALENHSATLLEAMTVGTPCVASFVGGVGEYAENEKNALLYRFENYEMLAFNIMRIFEERELRSRLSANAKETVSAANYETADYNRLKTILENI